MVQRVAPPNGSRWSAIKRSDPLLWVGALAVVVGWGLVLLNGSGSDGTPSTSSAVVAGVCAALEASEDGSNARAVFYDRAHDDLHELAAETSALDREVAARLLRSKERVEALLDGPRGTETTAALGVLSDVTAEAVSVADPGSDEDCQ